MIFSLQADTASVAATQMMEDAPVEKTISIWSLITSGGIGGQIIPASAYLMKSPPVQIEDTEGRVQLEAFIRGE